MAGTLDALDDRDADETITRRALATKLDLRVELWHPDLSGPFEDISEWVSLTGSSLAYDDRASVRHTGTLRFDAEVDWNAYRLAVYVDIANVETGGTHTAAMGVYLVDGWRQVIGTEPRQYDVDIVDLMAVLDTPIGATYAVAAGTSYRQAIIDVAAAAGGWSRFEPAGAAAPLAPPVEVAADTTDAYVVGSRIIELGGGHTWLDVLSHLAEGGGYRQPYSRRDGTIVVDAARELATTTTISSATAHPVVGVNIERTTDLRLRPNQWVIVGQVIDPSVASPGQTETMLLTHTDLQTTTGEHSFTARGRRVVRRVYQLDAPATSSDVAGGYERSSVFARAAARLVEADREAVESLRFSLTPTTTLWHNDVIELPEVAAAGHFGVEGRWRVTDWQLPLDGRPMTVRATKVER